jgi:hypothetical protein
MKAIPFNEYGYGYRDLVDSFEVKVLVEDQDDDYEGDSRYLLKSGRQYGVLVFGWGSCSGCDALEAAGSNLAEVTALRDELWNSIRWEHGPRAMLNYFESTDFSLKFGRWGPFVEKSTETLKEILSSR